MPTPKEQKEKLDLSQHPLRDESSIVCKSNRDVLEVVNGLRRILSLPVPYSDRERQIQDAVKRLNFSIRDAHIRIELASRLVDLQLDMDMAKKAEKSPIINGRERRRSSRSVSQNKTDPS